MKATVKRKVIATVILTPATVNERIENRYCSILNVTANVRVNGRVNGTVNGTVNRFGLPVAGNEMPPSLVIPLSFRGP
jgi:hypothetical protein